jgi:hypothetical protein
MLAAVPSCAGQCRFVRGFLVGAAGCERGLVGILWDTHNPKSAVRPDFGEVQLCLMRPPRQGNQMIIVMARDDHRN